MDTQTRLSVESQMEELIDTFSLEDILSVVETVCLLKAMRIRERGKYITVSQLWRRRAYLIRECILACEKPVKWQGGGPKPQI